MWAQGGRDKEVTSRRNDYFRQSHLPSVEGRGPITPITLLVLLRKFCTHWFKIPLLREAESKIRLGSKSWFADLGLSVRHAR